MNQVKDLYPFYITNDIGTSIEHRPQYLSSHDETRGLRPQADISSKKANIKFPTEVPVLLIADSFYWSSVNSSGAVLQHTQS